MVKCVRIKPHKLKGRLNVPPSKSLCHRAVIGASLSGGVSNLENILFSDDIRATIRAMEKLGSKIERVGEAGLKIEGSFINDLDRLEINCKESGSTLRFLIPISLLSQGQVVFNGEGELRSRPLDPYYSIFDEQGIEYKTDSGKLPLEIKGELRSGEFKLAGDISSQFVTGLLFALPLLEGDSKIAIVGDLESKGYVDLTIDVLEEFGIEIENKNYKQFLIKGRQAYKARDHRVEGDFSQAAFWMVAAILGGQIESGSLNPDSLQADKAIVDLILKMGGDLSFQDGFFIAKESKTHGITIDASQCPDLVPILAVLAALSKGRTKIINAARLRIKESDRLKAISSELNKLGADVKEVGDSLVIDGVKSLKGGQVDSWKDHRIAMALAIASIKCKEELVITNSHAVTKSYPHFWEDFKKLGGRLDEFNMGR